MKINNLSAVMAVLNNKTTLQKDLEAPKLADQRHEALKDTTVTVTTKKSVVSMKDIREMLINLNFQLTDLNLDIAKKLLKHRMPLSEKNIEEVLKILKQLGNSKCLDDLFGQDARAIVKDLGLSLAVFLLERNISPEPKILDLMLKLMLREVESEDVLNYKTALEASTLTKSSVPYNYYPLNLELKGQSNLFLELFILPEGHNAEQAEKDRRIVFSVDSKKLGLVKFDLGFGPRKLDLKILLEREELLGYVDQNISILNDQLINQGQTLAGITCRLNKQNSFSYVESLLELPQYQLDARV